MRRVALMLSAVAILFVAANAAEAHGWNHGHKHRGYHGQYYYGYRAPSVLRGQVLMGPTLYVPPPQPIWYSPAPCRRYYAPVPQYNFYYRGRGLSFGFGF